MPIVLDIGTETCRVGFSGENCPRRQFPTMVGRPRHKNWSSKYGSKQDVWVGDAAFAIRGTLSIKYPVEWGIVTNFDDYEEVLKHCFYQELAVSPEDEAVLITEPVMNPRANKEKITQIIFEGHDAKALYVAPQSVLSLFSSGKSTGLVVESTATSGHVIPIYEGHVLPYAVMKLLIGGRDVNWKLQASLQEQCNTDFLNRFLVDEIKKKLAYVAEDYEEELHIASSADYKCEKYELPDGNLVSVGAERFQCAEIIFQPKEMEMPGIHEITFNCIQRCNSDLRQEMCSNIVLTGGNTLLPGFIERFTKELTSLIGNNMDVSVTAPPDGTCSAWVGGSILASLPSFEDMVMTKEDYDEYGPSLITKKCF